MLLMRIMTVAQIIHSITPILISGSFGRIWLFGGNICPDRHCFLVWSQGRTSSAEDGSFAYGKDMKDLFGIQPHNVFLIKFFILVLVVKVFHRWPKCHL